LAPANLVSRLRDLRFVGEGSIAGRIYNLGEYPGAVPDPHSERTIFGRVFELRNPEGMLLVFDDYEGYRKDAPSESLFVRQQLMIRLEGGRRIRAWMYVYQGICDGRAEITSGRWLPDPEVGEDRDGF
jgi:gamma-glutamylcyclotransferase (GGCT)/AIG2-like uncharacterized protein YtfP